MTAGSLWLTIPVVLRVLWVGTVWATLFLFRPVLIWSGFAPTLVGHAERSMSLLALGLAIGCSLLELLLLALRAGTSPWWQDARTAVLLLVCLSAGGVLLFLDQVSLSVLSGALAVLAVLGLRLILMAERRGRP